MGLIRRHSGLLLSLLLLSGLMLSGGVCDAKKGKKSGDADLQKQLETVQTDLTPLVQKGAAHGLFSPDEIGKLVQIKLTLMDMIQKTPTNEALVKPVFQAAQLFKSREMYDDAYDFFNYLSTNFPNTPYGVQSGVEIQRLKEKLGQTYFAQPQ